ncbi:MAG TPA: hypothetical protein VH591_04260 [Ktedonobacterales bacterium]|jgi:hypothetical protein
MEIEGQAGLIHLVYRHGDVDDTAGRIYDRLAARYGRERILRDLFAGADEPPPESAESAAQAHLDSQMDRVLAQVVVIGPRWLDGVSRPNDRVRMEVAAAFHRQAPLIPVLAEGAMIPAGAQLPEDITQLAYFNAAQARLDPDFDADMQRLLATIERYTPGLVAHEPVAPLPGGATDSAQAHLSRRGCSPWRALALSIMTPALLFLLVAIIVARLPAGETPPSALAATPPATATYLPTPFPTGSYFSPLTGGAPDWLTGDQCQPQSDGLHVVNSNTGCQAADAAAAPDGDLSVTARQISGASNAPYGLFFRAPIIGQSHYYAVLISSSGMWSAIRQLAGTVYLAPWSASSAIHTGLGATNVIEVRFQGTRLTFLINGVDVGALTDSGIPAAGTADDPGLSDRNGLIGHTGAEIDFTNYRLQPVA